MANLIAVIDSIDVKCKPVTDKGMAYDILSIKLSASGVPGGWQSTVDALRDFLGKRGLVNVTAEQRKLGK